MNRNDQDVKAEAEKILEWIYDSMEAALKEAGK